MKGCVQTGQALFSFNYLELLSETSVFGLRNEGRQKPRVMGDIHQVFSNDKMGYLNMWCSHAAGPRHLVSQLHNEFRPCGTENTHVLVLPAAAQVHNPWGKNRPMAAVKLLKHAH